MVLLALRPEGMSAEEVAIATHGDFGKPVTARAELSRLRRILGPRLLAEPYRLDAAPRADFLTAGELAGAGALHAALDAYPGPLLPRSELPLVVEARESLDHRMRSAILRSGDRRPPAPLGPLAPPAATTSRPARRSSPTLPAGRRPPPRGARRTCAGWLLTD